MYLQIRRIVYTCDLHDCVVIFLTLVTNYQHRRHPLMLRWCWHTSKLSFIRG